MPSVCSVRVSGVVSLLAASLLIAGCGASGDASEAMAVPGAPTPTGAQAVDTPPADGEGVHLRFVSGTSYAATGVRAEVELHADNQRTGDVLQAIADLGGVPLEVAPDTTLDLDRPVTLNFSSIPLETVFTLLTHESMTAVSATDDAIRVHPAGAPAG